MSDTNEVVPFVDVTEDDKIEFYKAFLSDTPYTATVKLFGGQFSVKFKALSIKESTDVFDQLKRDQAKSLINNDASYLMTLTNYRLAQGLIEINDEAFQPDITFEKYKPTDDYDSYVKDKANVFKAWTVFKLSAIAEAFKNFEDKILFLTKEVQTEGFWAAAK